MPTIPPSLLGPPRVQLEMGLQAEILTRAPRMPLRFHQRLMGWQGETIEQTILPGSVHAPILPAWHIVPVSLVILPDQPCLLYPKGMQSGTPVALQAGGMFLLSDTRFDFTGLPTITYDTSNAVSLQLVVVALLGSGDWIWIPRYKERFPFTTNWYNVWYSLEEWNTKNWEEAGEDLNDSVTYNWVIYYAGPGGGFFNPPDPIYAFLDTTTPIVGPSSLRLQQDKTDHIPINMKHFIKAFPTFHGIDFSGESGGRRYRTLLRFEVPPIDVLAATGVHWIGFCWAETHSGSQGGDAGYGFFCDYDVHTGMVSSWRYGAFDGNQSTMFGEVVLTREAFLPISTGTFSPPIAPGTVCAMEVYQRLDFQNAESRLHWVKFGVGTDYDALPTLVYADQRLGEGGVLYPVDSQHDGLQYYYILPATDGTYGVTFDQTEIWVEYNDARRPSVEAWDYAWYPHWQYHWYSNTGTPPISNASGMIVEEINDNDPLVSP